MDTKPAACTDHQHHHHGSDTGAIYGLGVIGALFYFLPHARTIGDGAWAIGKSIVWPALFVYQALTLLKL